MNRRTIAAAAALVAGCLAAGGSARADENAIRPVAGKEAEQIADGSSGRIVEFRGADGSYIPAYMRRPRGAGPFPVVVLLHGGAPDPGITYTLGRTTNPPVAAFVASGWALLAIDFHPNPTVPTTDREDAASAIEAVRHLPFIDGARVALFGGSHGANVITRIAARVDVRCGVVCAPAAIDLIEISKAMERGVEVVGVLKKMVQDASKKYGAPLSRVALDPAKYGYESALTEAPKVRFPILIVNGRNDTSAPIPVSQTYADRLRAAGKQVETYFPDNGLHGFYFGFMDNRGSGKPSNVTAETREAAKRATAFIRKSFAE